MSEVLIIIIIYLIAKLSLDILQIQTIKTVPIDQQSIDLLGINSNEEYKSRRYNIEKLKISILSQKYCFQINNFLPQELFTRRIYSQPWCNINSIYIYSSINVTAFIFLNICHRR